MELIYIKIFEPDFVYIHIGTVLVLALIGAFVHLATQSCSTKHLVPLSKLEARHLLTFPEHICFHGSMTYPVQTGRVLRATWSILWFIMCSAYVAFLATEFTVKPPEEPINTFQKIYDAKDFKIGTMTVPSTFLDIYVTNKNTHVKDIMNRMRKQNKTDNITFDTNVQHQAKRVLKGNYALISGYCINIGTCDEFFMDNLPEIRAYELSVAFLLDFSYFATPKHVFYDRDLYRVLLNFEEMGILKYLRESHFRSRLKKELQSNKLNKSNGVVTFARILIPVYLSIVGVSISAVCLGLEVMYNKWKRGL